MDAWKMTLSFLGLFCMFRGEMAVSFDWMYRVSCDDPVTNTKIKQLRSHWCWRDQTQASHKKEKQHNNLKNQPSFINSWLVNDEIPQKEWLMDEIHINPLKQGVSSFPKLNSLGSRSLLNWFYIKSCCWIQVWWTTRNIAKLFWMKSRASWWGAYPFREIE